MIEDPYRNGNYDAGIKNWEQTTIFKQKFLDNLKKLGIDDPPMFLKVNATDQLGRLVLNKAHKVY